MQITGTRLEEAMMSIFDAIKEWVSSQGDEAYQRKRKIREARVKEMLANNQKKRQEARDETKRRDN